MPKCTDHAESSIQTARSFWDGQQVKKMTDREWVVVDFRHFDDNQLHPQMLADAEEDLKATRASLCPAQHGNTKKRPLEPLLTVALVILIRHIQGSSSADKQENAFAWKDTSERSPVH